MLIVELRGKSIPLRKEYACQPVWHGGNANQLSTETIAYPVSKRFTRRQNSGGTPSAAFPPPSRLPLAPEKSSCHLPLRLRAPLGPGRGQCVQRIRWPGVWLYGTLPPSLLDILHPQGPPAPQKISAGDCPQPPRNPKERCERFGPKCS
jgi:hypothetical protein